MNMAVCCNHSSPVSNKLAPEICQKTNIFGVSLGMQYNFRPGKCCMIQIYIWERKTKWINLYKTTKVQQRCLQFFQFLIEHWLSLPPQKNLSKNSTLCFRSFFKQFEFLIQFIQIFFTIMVVDDYDMMKHFEV